MAICVIMSLKYYIRTGLTPTRFSTNAIVAQKTEASSQDLTWGVTEDPHLEGKPKTHGNDGQRPSVYAG